MALGGILGAVGGAGGGAVASIIVKAQTMRAEKAMARLGKNIEGTERQTGKMAGVMKMAGPVMVTAGIAAAGAAVHLATVASKGVEVRNAFERMAAESGRSSQQLLQNMSKAAAGTVSKIDLMKQANQAFLLVGSEVGEKLPKMMEIARAAAKATGQDVGFMFQSIVTGIGRQSKMILDNLGINIKMSEAQEKYAATLGKTAAQLTEAEKKQAFMNEAMAQGEDIIRRTGSEQVSFNEKMAQFSAALDDIKQALGEVLIPVLTTAIDVLTNLGDAVGAVGASVVGGAEEMAIYNKEIMHASSRTGGWVRELTPLEAHMKRLEDRVRDTSVVMDDHAEKYVYLTERVQKADRVFVHLADTTRYLTRQQVDLAFASAGFESSLDFLTSGNVERTFEKLADRIRDVGYVSVPATVSAFQDWKAGIKDVEGQLADVRQEMQHIQALAVVEARELTPAEKERLDYLRDTEKVLRATTTLMTEEQPEVARVLTATGAALNTVREALMAIHKEAKEREMEALEDQASSLASMLTQHGVPSIDAVVRIMGQPWTTAWLEGGMSMEGLMEIMGRVDTQFNFTEGRIRFLETGIIDLKTAFEELPDEVSTTVTTVFKTVGSRPAGIVAQEMDVLSLAIIAGGGGGAPPLSPTGDPSGGRTGTGQGLAMQKGFHGIIRKATWLLVGEHGDERVDVSPLGARALGLLAGGGGGGGPAPPPSDEEDVLSTGTTGGFPTSEPAPAPAPAPAPTPAATQAIGESVAQAIPQLAQVPALAAAVATLASKPPPKIVNVTLNVSFQSSVQVADETEMRRTAGLLKPYLEDAVNREA